MEEGPSAGQVAVVEAHGSGEDLRVAAQQGALPAALTLDSAAVNVSVATASTAGMRCLVRQDRGGRLSADLPFWSLRQAYLRVSTGDVGAVGQLTTVSIFVPLFVHR